MSATELTTEESLLQQAVQAQRRGDMAAARGLYAELLTLDPDQPEALHFIGLMDWQDGHGAVALGKLEAAARARPQSADILNNLGTVYLGVGRQQDALRVYARAVELSPKNPSFAANLGVALLQVNQPAAAVALARKMLAQAPGFAAMLNVLGNGLRRQGDLQGGLAAFRELVAVAPADPESYYNLGVALQDLWQMDEARAAYEKAIALNPKPEARYYVNHGAALLKLHDIGAARQSYARAIELAPDLAEAHYNYAICLFLLGELEEAARHYEWRLKVDETSLSKPRDPGVPMWDGVPALDKTILLHSEQGLGDMIQFVRFAPVVAAMCKHVVVEVQKPLVTLFASSLPGITVIAKGSEVPPVDAHAPLMSLMAKLKLQLDDLPAVALPYLASDPARTALWKEKLGNKPGIKVAIVWQGNPKAKVDRGRSIPLLRLAPLLQLEGVRFISLQKNEGAEQIAALPPQLRERIEVLDDSFDSGPDAFLDTIAVMQNCDLVLTTDTAIAHIAGGINAPTWLMLKKTPDWRWMLHRPDTPWYPATRLFRQQEEDNWEGVAEAVSAALQEEFGLQPAIVTGIDEETVAVAVPAIPAVPAATLDMALALHQQGKLDDAEVIYKQHLAQPQARHHLGVIAYQRGQADIAETHIRAALLQEPDNADMLANLALAIKAQGRVEEAVALCRQVLAQRPTLAPAHNNLANLLKMQGALEEAIGHYSEAVRLSPQAADLRHNLGIALMEAGRLSEAEAALRQAVALASANPDYHFDLARALLMQGSWPEGWQEYEYRRQMKEFGAASMPDLLQWDGTVNAQLRLLVVAEQGLGDTLQFARFIAQAKARVGQVVLVVPPQLKALCSTVPGVDAVCGYGEPLPDCAAYIALPSLPAVFGTTLETLPVSVPYLQVDPIRKARWQVWRSQFKGRVIGINWQGNPKARADVGRSLRLAQLAALGELHGITFVSLQKGSALEQVADLPAGFPLVVPSAPFDDGPDAFLDTAALMQVCDLVLTTDTSIAHLSGALGRPTWVMLKSAPDWRWMLNRSDYPWYPSMRLFRQPRAGDWASVIADVKAALAGSAAADLPTALKLHQQGRIREAASLYVQVLAQQPDEIVARHYLGVARYQLGDIAAAQALLEPVVEEKPDYADAWGNLALVYKSQQKFDTAIAAFERALTLNPAAADVHNNYGNLLAALKKYDEAVAHYQHAIRLQPNRPDSYQNMGNAMGDLERYQEAIENFRRAIALKPDYVAAMNGLGKAYRSLGQLDAAIAVFREAAKYDVSSPDPWSNMGVCYREQLNYREALACYDEALKRNPQHAESFSNRAIAYHFSGQLEKAEDEYRKAIALKPERADVQFGLGSVLLTQGKWPEGWRQYEWRRRMSDSGPLRTFPQPLWDGSIQPDKTLFLFVEQGLGDTLQFIRFLALARPRVGRIIIEVQPGLRRLLAESAGDATIIAQGDEIPPFDVYAPLMSLPGLLGLDLPDLPAPKGYIQPEPALVAAWAERLKGTPGLRVGLNWQGNPKASVDKGRSIPLQQLTPLLDLPDVRFICLQKNAGLEQLEQLTPEQRARIETLGDDFDSGKDAFIDTAAVMANLDLILTTDTAMAHLAGALGRPCWVMLKFMPDWRWMVGRSDTPWYPSTQLFRQSREGDWADVVAQVLDSMKEITA